MKGSGATRARRSVRPLQRCRPGSPDEPTVGPLRDAALSPVGDPVFPDADRQLFACSGAGGALIEEEESGTLERLLTTRLGMTRLLIGKWLFLTTMGIAEVVVMFVWGMLVFNLDLLGHLPGFATMTIVTASAAAAFGLVLATACRSRAQLSGISTIVILTMSAMGGSMFPRFLMTETMQKIGLCTFNAWALDGYVKVFWRDAALLELWPQVGVLVGLSAVFLLVARLLARRWETI